MALHATLLRCLLFLAFWVTCPAATPAAPKAPSAKLVAAAASLATVDKAQLMTILNHGDIPSLVDLPGIGEIRAEALQKGRPYETALDLLRVKGIGEATLFSILGHAQAGFPELEPPAKQPKKKPRAPAAPKAVSSS